jgi:calcium-binding protein CML
MPFIRPLHDAFRILDKDAFGTISVADLYHALNPHHRVELLHG